VFDMKKEEEEEEEGEGEYNLLIHSITLGNQSLRLWW